MNLNLALRGGGGVFFLPQFEFNNEAWAQNFLTKNYRK